MKNTEPGNKEGIDQEDEHARSVLNSIRSSKIWLPIFIGLAAIVYMLFSSFDATALKTVTWSPHTTLWLFFAVCFALIRDLFYTFRLYHLAGDVLGFWKCFKLILIWEFSSAVSPTALGGSAVAVFVLSQEKLGASRTLATILYTVVLDSMFFVTTIPVLLVIFGFNIINPTYTGLDSIDGVAYSLLFFYLIILTYSMLFAYGLFINPHQFKKILVYFTSWRLLKRFRQAAVKLGDDMVITANEIVQKNWRFHLRSFLFTAAAWTSRFIIVNCLIIALIEHISYHPWDQLKIFGRQIMMFLFMMFSPTPGAAGFAEVFFGSFIGDYIPKSAALIIALIWRFLTYYIYLIVGVIIVPTWLAGIIKKRRESRMAANQP